MDFIYDRENNDAVEKAIYSEFNLLLRIFAVFPSLKREHILITAFQLLIYNLIMWYHLIIIVFTIQVVYYEVSLFNITVHYFLLMLLVSIFLTAMLPKRKHLCRMYKISSSGFFSYNEDVEDSHLEKINKEIRKEKITFFLLLSLIITIALFAVILRPGVDKLLGYYEEGSHSELGLNQLMPFKAWYPYETNEGFMYYVTLFGQLAIAALISGNIGCLTLIYINSVQKLIQQCRILMYSLENIEARATEKFKKMYCKGQDNQKVVYDDRYHKCYYFCLRENIIHQNIIYNYFEEMNSFLSLPMQLALLSGTLVIALSMYELAQGRDTVGSMMISGLLVLAEILILFIVSFFGEKMIKLSVQLRDCIYSIKWYKYKNPYVKNMIPIMLERTKREMVMKSPFSAANFETFSTVLNTAYSYFNVLSATKSHQ